MSSKSPLRNREPIPIFNAPLRTPTVHSTTSFRRAACERTCIYIRTQLVKTPKQTVKRAHAYSEILNDAPSRKLRPIFQRGLKRNFCSKAKPGGFPTEQRNRTQGDALLRRVSFPRSAVLPPVPTPAAGGTTGSDTQTGKGHDIHKANRSRTKHKTTAFTTRLTKPVASL